MVRCDPYRSLKMKLIAPLLCAAGLFAASGPLMAQDTDFTLTYHVERTPSARLDINACGDAAMKAAEAAGLISTVQRFPEQLVSVSGGREGAGAYVVQCIAVDDMTVSVVHGIDYRDQKAAMGEFADAASEAVAAATK